MSLSNSQINEIIGRAVYAPSGENAQPWKFEVRNDVLHVYNIPELDNSLYNASQLGSYIAHGALIENIDLIARHNALTASVSLFPNKSIPNLIASITFEKSNDSDSETELLYQSITQRCTNRKAYESVTLPSSLRKKILGTETGHSVSIYLAEEADKQREIAHAASVNERLLFEVPEMTNFFFSHIQWSLEEHERNSRGFFIDTLELEPPQLFVMKLLRNNFFQRLFRKIGIAKMIAEDNAKRYMTASAHGCIVISGSNPQDYIQAGRAFQRVWLIVTAEKWSMQPMTGLLFLYRSISEGRVMPFDHVQQNLIRQAYKDMFTAFNISTGNLVLTFRIGRSAEPSGRSERVIPEVTFS